MRRAIPSAPLIAALVALAGCGSGEDSGDVPQPSAAPQGLTVAASSAMPRTFDAALAQTRAERAIAAAIQTPLLTYRRRADADAATLEPALAEALPALSDDRTEYRFNLRPGLLYADGRLVKASDVERSISHASRQATDPELRAALADIIGAPSKDGETLPGVRTDDRTGAIVVRLREPDGRIPLALADPATAPQPELPSQEPGALPVSTGPLRVARITDDSVELVANPLRARISTVPAAQTQQVSVTDRAPNAATLASGDIDVVLGPGTLAQPPRGATIDAPSGAVWSLVLSAAGALADRPVREAIDAAIDRRGIDAEVPNLVAACGLLPSYVVGAVVRDDCPPAPVKPRDAPLAGITLRVAVPRPSEGEAAGDTSPRTATERVVSDAIEGLGGTATQITVADPAAALRDGRAEAALVRVKPALPHPAGFLEPVAIVDALLAREIPQQTAGPLTGASRRWSALERRAVDRAVAIPIAAERAAAITSEQVDRGSVVLHPVLGLDLSALALR